MSESTHAPLLFRTQMPVRWRDMDAFNHVNNAMYLRYIEEARLRWMISLAGPWKDEHVGPVLASVLLDFREPIAWPEEVIVELFVERIGNSSCTLGHRILSAKDADVLYCDGNHVLVWFDQRIKKSSPLPVNVRSALEAAG